MIIRCFIVVLCAFTLFSCSNNKYDSIRSILREWEQKEILFPSCSVFTIQGRDTVDFKLQNKYKVITYIDSVGCTSCKLHLSEWANLIYTVDSIHPNTVQFLFFFSPKKRMEIYQTLLANRFKYPVCIDDQDSINILNNFPSNAAFQTFLIDKKNRVLAIGNPIYNPKIKKLYLNLISGDNEGLYPNSKSKTDIFLDTTLLNFGTFNWQQERTVDLLLRNIGDEFLVLDGVSTSCGCTVVEYNKEPVRPGSNLELKVKYKAEHPGYFNKTIAVYCNTKDSPIQLRITGNAK